jgi:hypothetical protein
MLIFSFYLLSQAEGDTLVSVRAIEETGRLKLKTKKKKEDPNDPTPTISATVSAHTTLECTFSRLVKLVQNTEGPTERKEIWTQLLMKLKGDENSSMDRKREAELRAVVLSDADAESICDGGFIKKLHSQLRNKIMPQLRAEFSAKSPRSWVDISGSFHVPDFSSPDSMKLRHECAVLFDLFRAMLTTPSRYRYDCRLARVIEVSEHGLDHP